MYFRYYYDPGYVYVPFGCIDTAPQVDVPATLVFSPDLPVPPIPADEAEILGATGDRAGTFFNSDIEGTLSIWLCVRDPPGAPSENNGGECGWGWPYWPDLPLRRLDEHRLP